MSNDDKNKEAEMKLSRDIKDSLDTLQSNVIDLAQNIRAVSADKANMAADFARDRADDLKDMGADALKKTEKSIKASPGRSVAIAFAAGILTSLLLGRRK